MFYEQFSKITNLLNPEFVERFDCWLATLPSNNQKNITASSVAARLGASYTQAEEILKYAERQKILEKELSNAYKIELEYLTPFWCSTPWTRALRI